MICAVRAQVVEQGEPAVVYYSPKTLVMLDFAYSVEKQEPGIFAQYAEAMIGAKDAVKEAKITYAIKDVNIHTKTIPDLARPHKILPEKDFPLLLTINEKGLLTGYNMPYVEKKRAPRDEPKKCDLNKAPVQIPPYPEEVLKAANPLAQAHAVAKQIFHIRETRMYLLNGEVEHAPADGEAMKQVLAELDKQEQALTELFMGKTSRRIEHKQVILSPEEKKNILYFSDENGFTDAENLEASTIVISINARPQQFKQVEGKQKKTAPVSQLVYNLPGNGEVKVLYKGNELAKRTIPVAQLGVDVPLPKDLFKGAPLPVIVFDEKTGNIVSISK